MVSYAYVDQNLSSASVKHGRHTEMLDSLPGVSLSSQQDGVCTLWCPQSQLIQSDDLATGLLDPLTGSLGDSQSGDAQLGDLQHSRIVRDSSYDDDGFVGIVLGGHLAADEADADGRTVDARLEETFEDDLVELGVGTTGEESVQLHEEKQVHVLRGRGLAVALADVVPLGKVNTLQVSLIAQHSAGKERAVDNIPLCGGCRMGNLVMGERRQFNST